MARKVGDYQSGFESRNYKLVEKVSTEMGFITIMKITKNQDSEMQNRPTGKTTVSIKSYT